MNKAYELMMKSLSSEELTDDEKKYLHQRNAKYELVRYVYMEKMEHKGSEIKQFQFSPGNKFMETPIFDIVNGLLKVMQSLKDVDYEVVDYGDLDWVHNPPHSGREKTTLDKV